jgi:AcrR family transcriptional regulator
MMTKRLRKSEILSAALMLAERHGLHAITRDQIANSADCSTGIVNFHFGTMKQLRRAIVGEAIRVKNLRVIAQALVMGDSRANGIPDELKRAAALSLSEG